MMLQTITVSSHVALEVLHLQRARLPAGVSHAPIVHPCLFWRDVEVIELGVQDINDDAALTITVHDRLVL